MPEGTWILIVTCIGFLVTIMLQCITLNSQKKLAIDIQRREHNVDLLIKPQIDQLNEFINWLEFPLNIITKTNISEITRSFQNEWRKEYVHFGSLAREIDKFIPHTKSDKSLEAILIDVNQDLIDWIQALELGTDPIKATEEHLTRSIMFDIPSARNKIEIYKEKKVRNNK